MIADVDSSPRFREMWSDATRPPQRLNVWQWAEKNIVISERVSPSPGRYRSDFTPYCRGPMEWITDRHVRDIVLVFCAQAGKTQNLITIPAAYAIKNDPGPAIAIMPNEPMARSFSETRLQPIFNDCPAVARLKPTDTDKYKLLEMHFAGMTLNLVGSNSPANLASRPIRYMYADEIDKFPPATDKESDALSLAYERTSAYWNALRIETSTPSTPDGNIWRLWRRSTRYHYMMLCPHCGKWQKFIFGIKQEYEYFDDVVPQPTGDRESLYRVRWPKDCAISDLDSRAWYDCIYCHAKITDADRRRAIRGGKWEAPGTGIATTRGAHLNRLCVPWFRLGEIAAEFLRAKRHPDQLHNFFNSWLAIPWDAVAQGTDTIRIDRIRRGEGEPIPADGYVLNNCPDKVLFLTAGFDVQAHEIYFVVRGWGRGEYSALISFGCLPVETDDVAEFARTVGGVMARKFGRPLILSGIDSGWGKHTSEVYEIARMIGAGLVCTKGRRSNITKTSGAQDVPIPRPKRIDKMPDGKPLKRGPLLFSPSVGFYKKLVFARINSTPPCWEWPIDLETSRDGQLYLRHLESEREVTETNKKTGRTEIAYVVRRGYGANHWLDCEVIATVVRDIALSAGSEDARLTWDQIEHALQSIPDMPPPMLPDLDPADETPVAPPSEMQRAVARTRKRSRGPRSYN